MNNVITKSFDYSQIDMDEREANPVSTCIGDHSSVFYRLYGYDYFNCPSINLDPPPLFIQCLLKLRGLGFNADPSIFKSYPELETVSELMKGIKITPWYIHGGPIRQVWYKNYIHVNDNGERTDYRWHGLKSDNL